MRRKGKILSQNRYFHPAFGGFAPWNPYQGSALHPLGGSQYHQTPSYKRPSNYSLSRISILKIWQVCLSRKSCLLFQVILALKKKFLSDLMNIFLTFSLKQTFYRIAALNVQNFKISLLSPH